MGFYNISKRNDKEFFFVFSLTNNEFLMYFLNPTEKSC